MKSNVRGIIKYFPFVFFIASFIFFLYCLSIERSGVITNDEPVFIENWTITDSAGNITEVGRTYVDDRAYTEDFVISTTLPEIGRAHV